MTALAGMMMLADLPVPSGNVEAMLAAQARYAKFPPVTAKRRYASIGRAIYPLLREDRFDAGPQESIDGALMCVADVRLDNRASLATDLGITAIALEQMCDASLIVAAWQAWGTGAFDRFSGDFAVAIVDLQQNRLILARDLLGQRPIFFHCGEGWVGFASMPSGLLALPMVATSLNPRVLADYLRGPSDPSTQSIFDGIRSVPPGHWMAIDTNGEELHRYWAPPPPASATGNKAERTDKARNLFDNAVNSCLRSNGVIGSHLSGGIDSGAVTIAAARQLSDKQILHSCTAVLPGGFDVASPKGRFIDEAPLASLSAAQVGNIAHHMVAASIDEFSAPWDKAVAIFQCPLPNPCNYRWAAAINDMLQAQGVTTLLTGQMGNLSISFQLPHDLATTRAALSPIWPSARRRLANMLRAARRLGADRQRQVSFDNTTAPPPASCPAKPIATSSYDARITALGLFDFGVFNKGILAGWGIDVRDPTANRELIDYCLSLPDGDFAERGIDRALARRAFADLLPPAVLDETRRGLQSADWRLAMHNDKAALLGHIDAVQTVDVARWLIDLPRLRATVARLRGNISPGQADETMLRRGALRALAACHFIKNINALGKPNSNVASTPN